MSEQTFLNTVEASRLLHKTPQSLRNDRYLKRGINFYKMGKKVFYAMEDIENYFKESNVLIS